MPERKPFAKIHGVRELLHSQIYVYDFFDFMTSLISLKQYCFNQNIEIVCLFLILSWIFSNFGQVLSQPVDTQSAGRIFRLTQNHAYRKNAPNTVAERPSTGLQTDRFREVWLFFTDLIKLLM